MPQAPKTYAGRIARRKGLVAAALSALLAIGAVAGGTSAYLTAKSDAYLNTFVSGLPTLGTLDGLVTVKGDKAINGRGWQAGDTFQFTVEYLVDGEWVTLGSGPAAVTYEVDAQGNPVEGFDEFDLTEAVRSIEMEAGETRSFRAYEVIPDGDSRIAGMSYDPAKHYFDVTAADADGDGVLEVSEVRVAEPASTSDISESASDGADVTNETAPASSEGDELKSAIQVAKGDDGIWAVSLAFVNAYSASGEAQAVIHAKKSLEDASGQDMKPSGFEFELYAVDSQGGKALVESKVTTNAGLVDFALSYGVEDAGEVFEYELVEKDGGSTIAGMSYDDTRYLFQVKVTDELDGTLSAKVSDVEQDGDAHVGVDQSTEGAPENEYLATFLNVYDPADASASVSGTVELVGRYMAEGEFSFVVRSLTEGAPELDLSRDANDGSGAFSFGDATFPKVGTYIYEVTQDASAQLEGVTYDTSVYRIEVTVGADADSDGVLDVAVKVLRDGTEVTDGTGVKYVNRYEKPDDGGDGPGGDDPEDPGDDGDGDDPDGPSGEDDPSLPDSGGSDDGDSVVPGGSGNGPGGTDLEQTGDSTFAVAALAASLAIVAAIIAILAARRAGRGSHDR